MVSRDFDWRVMLMDSKKNLMIALAVAVLADALQILLLPLTIGGGFMPVDDVIDFVIAGVMTYLLGWHWVFLPTAAAKLVPFVDMAPFWTLAVFFVALRQKKDLTTSEPLKTDQLKPVEITIPSSQFSK